MGDATIPASDDWNIPATSGGWSTIDEAAPTVAGSAGDLPTYRAEASVPTAQATANRIEQPARFILRSENGEVLQEYLLDKFEITIGRAPNSDILLSKDKLTSRRHAIAYYENGQYLLRDEHSANGTFVNGQQLEEGAPRTLKDNDHVGIGEHELIFRTFIPVPTNVDLEGMETMIVPPESTFHTREDPQKTVTSTANEFETRPVENLLEVEGHKAEDEIPTTNGSVASGVFSAPNTPFITPNTPFIPDTPPTQVPSASIAPPLPPSIAPLPPTVAPVPPPVAPLPPPVVQSAPVPSVSNVSLPSSFAQSAPIPSVSITPLPIAKMAAPISAQDITGRVPPTPQPDNTVTFDRLTSLPSPTLPDLSGLTAALSTLDGQIMSLQQQFNETQEAMRTHEAEITQTTNQLRSAIRRVSTMMDNTIADVARSRESLAWADLLQLMDDVMNNPRDIEYVTKLARKARELYKVFQIHQNVLNTLAECNSLLRSMITDDR